MKTAVLMERKLFDGIIHQNSKTEFLSATDLLLVGNKFRIGLGLRPFDYRVWMRAAQVKEFMRELEHQVGEAVWVPARGRGQHTWCHAYLFIDLALAINPKLKIEVYKWLFDYLIRSRNESGDSYKEMIGALYFHHGNKSTFGKYTQDVCKRIRQTVGVDPENESAWQSATEEQLAHRNNIHNSIRILARVLRDNEQAVRLGILEASR